MKLLEKNFYIALVLTITIFLLGTALIKIDNYLRLKNYKLNKLITHEMSDLITQCGDGYFMSYIVINGNEYAFSEIYTTLSDNTQYTSVKHANCNYNQDRKDCGNNFIDKKTYKLLNSVDSGKVKYYENLDVLKPFPTIYYLLSTSKKQLFNGGFSIVKNYNNLIYVFVLTNSKKDNKKCQKKEFITILSNIAKITKEAL